MEQMHNKEQKDELLTSAHNHAKPMLAEVFSSLSVQVDVFHGDKFRNNFMHYADVFEDGKQLANYECFIITGRPNLEKLSINIKESLEKLNRNVVFVAIRSVDNVRVSNPNAYIKPNVQTISMVQNGNLGFAMFNDCLLNLGYKVVTNECMQVLSVSS